MAASHLPGRYAGAKTVRSHYKGISAAQQMRCPRLRDASGLFHDCLTGFNLQRPVRHDLRFPDLAELQARALSRRATRSITMEMTTQ